MEIEEKNYIELPSGRRLYGPSKLLSYGLDYVNIFGLVFVIAIGIIIGGKLL